MFGRADRDDRDFRILSDDEDLYVADLRGLNEVERGLAPHSQIPRASIQGIRDERSRSRRILTVDLIVIFILGIAVGIDPLTSGLISIGVSVLWFWVVGGNRLRCRTIELEMRFSADDGGSEDLVPIDEHTAGSADQEELRRIVDSYGLAVAFRDGREILRDLSDESELHDDLARAVAALRVRCRDDQVLSLREGELEDPEEEAAIWLEGHPDE